VAFADGDQVNRNVPAVRRGVGRDVDTRHADRLAEILEPAGPGTVRTGLGELGDVDIAQDCRITLPGGIREVLESHPAFAEEQIVGPGAYLGRRGGRGVLGGVTTGEYGAVGNVRCGAGKPRRQTGGHLPDFRRSLNARKGPGS